VIGLLVGFLVPAAVYKGIQDSLVVDKAEPEKEAYQHWLYNNYEDATPFYTEYTFYNLTNLDEVRAGAKPIYQAVGPYVYRYYTTKHEVEFLDDGNEFSCKLSNEYHYDANLSAPGVNPFTDTVIIPNLAYFSVIETTGSEQNLFLQMAAPTFVRERIDRLLIIL
jgi:hypothetical protein